MYKTRDMNGNIKYSGRSKATVVDNRDPIQRGRIRVDHPLVGITGWIDYLKGASEFNVPSIGDIVYIEGDTGEPEFAIASGVMIKGEDADPDVPDEFKRDIPTNRGWKTPGGHLVELDDGVATLSQAPNDKAFTTSNRGIRVTSLAGNKIHIVEDNAANNQYILLQDAGGNFIKLDYKNNVLTVNSIGSTNINTISDQTETVGGVLTINVTGNAIVNAAEIHLNGSAGNVLTTVSDPVVDSIYGSPTQGVPTVKAGS